MKQINKLKILFLAISTSTLLFQTLFFFEIITTGSFIGVEPIFLIRWFEFSLCIFGSGLAIFYLIKEIKRIIL